MNVLNGQKCLLEAYTCPKLAVGSIKTGSKMGKAVAITPQQLYVEYCLPFPGGRQHISNRFELVLFLFAVFQWNNSENRFDQAVGQSHFSSTDTGMFSLL